VIQILIGTTAKQITPVLIARPAMDVKEGRVVLIGDAKVGKTTLLHQFLHADSTTLHQPTAGAVFNSAKLTINDQEIGMQIWDTAGQERYRALGPVYYRKSRAAIAVFDLTDADTMKALESWISAFRQNSDDPFVVIAANKSDLTDEIALTIEETTAWASQMQAECIWTSALTGLGVGDVFGTIGAHLLRIRQGEMIRTEDTESNSRSCC
jgi:Ras-related protein Rab-21